MRYISKNYAYSNFWYLIKYFYITHASLIRTDKNYACSNSCINDNKNNTFFYKRFAFILQKFYTVFASLFRTEDDRDFCLSKIGQYQAKIYTKARQRRSIN